MDFFNENMWFIPCVIGIAAVIKIIILVVRSNNPNATNSPATSRDELGPIIYFANDSHNQNDNEFHFTYKKVNGSWRAYIIRMPDLGSRENSGLVTHRLFDDGSSYICWDSSVSSLTDIQNISRIWADNILEYIATGKRF